MVVSLNKNTNTKIKIIDMSTNNTSPVPNKKNNHKLLITTFIAVDVILIGLITLAFGGFAPGETHSQSFAAYETSSTVMTTQTSQSNSSIGVTVSSLITVNSSPTIFGTAPASSTVTISTSQENQTVMSDSNGAWKFIATAIYPVGIYDVRVEARDLSETIVGVDSTMDELEIISSKPAESSTSSVNISTPIDIIISESNSPNVSSAQTMMSESTKNSMAVSQTTASSALTLIAVPVTGVTSNVTSSKTSELAGLTTPGRTIASISSSKVTSVATTSNSSLKTNDSSSPSSSAPKASVETNNMSNTARTGGVDYLKIVSLLIFVAFNILIIKLKDKKVQTISLK